MSSKWRRLLTIPRPLLCSPRQCFSRSIEIHLRLRGEWTPGAKGMAGGAGGGRRSAWRLAIGSAMAKLGKPKECLEEMRALASEALSPVGGLAGDYEVWYR